MNLPSNFSPSVFLAIGVAIGAALAVALGNVAFLAAGAAIGATVMAFLNSRQSEPADSDPGDGED